MAKKIGREHGDLYTMVTPQMAEELLDRNTHNRPLRPGAVEKYARDMKAGRWQKNAQPVTIDWNNAIHNGQHRLFAVVESGVTVPMIVLTGLDPDTVLTVDSGVARNFQDYVALRGDASGQPMKNINNYAAVLRLIWWYENLWPGVRLNASRSGGATHHDLADIAARYPNLSEIVDYVQAKNGPVRNIIKPTAMAFVMAMGAQQYPAEVEHFLQTLWSNEGAPNDPPISLRQRCVTAKLSGHGLDRATELVFYIKAWNAYARGEKLAGYRWGNNELIPAIFGTEQYSGKNSAAKAIVERVEQEPDVKAKAALSRTGRRTKRQRVRRKVAE